MSRWEVWIRTDHRRLGGWYISGTLMVCAAVAFGALLGVSWVAGWSNLWHGLLQADWPWLIMAPVGVVVSHLGYSLPYREVARVDRRSGLDGEEAVAMVTTGFGPFSPGSGFALDARGLRTAGLTKQDAGRRILALGMLEYAILAPATFACALYLLRGHWHARAGVLSSWVVGVPAGAVVVIGLLLCYRHAGCPDTWWFPVRHFLGCHRSGLVDRLLPATGCSGVGGHVGLLGRGCRRPRRLHGRVHPRSPRRSCSHRRVCHRLRLDPTEPAVRRRGRRRSRPALRTQLGGLPLCHGRPCRSCLPDVQPVVRGGSGHSGAPTATAEAIAGGGVIIAINLRANRPGAADWLGAADPGG
jgi:hypothetical protein